MRIAVVAPLVSPLSEPPLGGVVTLLADLAAGIQGEGHEVTVFAASGSQLEGVEVADAGVRAEDLAGTVFRPMEASGEGSLGNGRAAEAFAGVYAKVAAGSFDVVHNHSFDVPAIELAPRAGCPVVHTLHLPPDPLISRAIASARAGSRPPVVAAVSESQMAAWRRTGHIDLLLRPGIPTGRIPWSDEHDGGLLVAGRISPEKGILDAIRIARAAGRPLTIAGHRYDETYAAEVDAALSAGEGAAYAGSLSRRRLWELMSRSAAVLFPIRWEEPFGLSAAEAQAAGCPVVGYRRGALPDLIAERVTGFTVEEGNVGAAAAAVEQALLLDRLDCRLHAEKHLDLAPTIEAHLRLYARMAG